jgi:hypothetical protein
LGLRWPAFGFSTTFDDKTKTLLTAIFVSVFSQKKSVLKHCGDVFHR